MTSWWYPLFVFYTLLYTIYSQIGWPNSTSIHDPSFEVAPCLKSNCQSWYIDILHFGISHNLTTAHSPPCFNLETPQRIHLFSNCSKTILIMIPYPIDLLSLVITMPMTFAYATHFCKRIHPCFWPWLCICVLGWESRLDSVYNMWDYTY